MNEFNVWGSASEPMITSPPTPCWGNASVVLVAGGTDVVVDGGAWVVVVVVSASVLEVQALTTRANEAAIDPIVTRRLRELEFIVTPLGCRGRGSARFSDRQ
jgi:hypothetical protein